MKTIKEIIQNREEQNIRYTDEEIIFTFLNQYNNEELYHFYTKINRNMLNRYSEMYKSLIIIREKSSYVKNYFNKELYTDSELNDKQQYLDCQKGHIEAICKNVKEGLYENS